MSTVTLTVLPGGAVRREGCRTVAVPGPLLESGKRATWFHCICRPGIRVGDSGRVLHAGDDLGVATGTAPRPRTERTS